MKDLYIVDDVYFTRVYRDTLVDRDIKYLQTVTGSRYNPFNGASLVEDVFSGRTALWRATEMQPVPKKELCYFVMALEIRNTAGGRLLEIVGIAGKGYFRRAATVLPVIKEFAIEHACYGIAGKTTSAGLRKLYEAFGAKEDYRYHVLEVG